MVVLRSMRRDFVVMRSATRRQTSHSRRINPALMLAEKMLNLLMLNEKKVMASLLTKGEDRVETNK